MKPPRAAQMATSGASGPKDPPPTILKREAKTIGGTWLMAMYPFSWTHLIVYGRSPGSPINITVKPTPRHIINPASGIHQTYADSGH